MSTIHLTGEKLPPKAEAVLKEILAAAGLTSARITDVTRTFDEQAQTIVNYYKQHGEVAAKRLYGNGPGGVAVAIFEKESKTSPMFQVLKKMADSMREAIRKERLSGGQRHLMHTSDTHYVFDIAPSSIASSPSFIREASKHPKVSRFLHPASVPPDKAYHLEIPK
ncbi:MAG: hypothetical protein RLY71_2258 [Pseudomonadota bacterium]|jgi:hypothetical protein